MLDYIVLIFADMTLLDVFRTPLDIFQPFLLQQNRVVLTGTMAISMHDCVDRNRHFKPNDDVFF